MDKKIVGKSEGRRVSKLTEVSHKPAYKEEEGKWFFIWRKEKSVTLPSKSTLACFYGRKKLTP